MFSAYKSKNPFPEMNSSAKSSAYSTSLPAYVIGKLVLPAQTRRACVRNLEKFAILREVDIDVKSVTIETHDGACVDGIEIKPKNDFQGQYIIKFNGNYMQYEDRLAAFAQEALKLKATIVGFNYRGVGNSKKSPYKFQDLVVDGIAQVERLIAEGVQPEKIILDGISLGGAVATMVAKYFHDAGQKVYLWNDRSLSSINKAAGGILLKENYEASKTAFSSISYSLHFSGWEEDIAKAYQSIPAAYKRYMVIAKASEACAGDGVIAHNASLHKGVRAGEKEKGINTGYKVFSLFPGHNAAREKLFYKEDKNKNGQQLFEEFVLSHNTHRP